MEPAHAFYLGEASMTDGGTFADELAALPRDPAVLCRIVQGVLLHADFAPWLYDVKLAPARIDDKHRRPLAQVLAAVRALDPRPLTAARAPGDRMACVCRTFALTLAAILQHQGVPARTRCGFAAYFTPGKFEDHWLTEYWSAAQDRWILVDAQLDELQRNALAVDFDPLDVPRDRFIVAGDAWTACRAGRADPDRYGLSHTPGLLGWWFIAGNLLRDLAALNRVEMLPWDVWGAMPQPGATIAAQRYALLDEVAALTIAGDAAHAARRALYAGHEDLRVPPIVFNVLRNASEPTNP